ncbi:MAG: c-type cytochrome [Sulfurimonas sp.]|nr:c-type cytochrome [Sulfurimonas sp.]
MKKIILSLSISMLFLANATAKDAVLDKGKSIFEAKSCVLCHKPETELIGPSLKRIAKAYKGKQAALVDYLKSQGKPIIFPKRAAVMNPQLIKTKILLGDDIRALATYLITVKGKK